MLQPYRRPLCRFLCTGFHYLQPPIRHQTCMPFSYRNTTSIASIPVNLPTAAVTAITTPTTTIHRTSTLDKLLNDASSISSSRYSLYRMFLKEREQGVQHSTQSLHTLLQIAAGHIPTPKTDFSAFQTQCTDSCKSWDALINQLGGFTDPVSSKPSFTTKESSLLISNSSFLISLDLSIALTLRDEIEARERILSPTDVSSLMTVLSRKGRAQKVVALFNLQKSMLAVSRESYWMVMQAFQISTNRMGKSLVWYHRMLQDESIPRPGIRIFRLLLKGYLFTGDRDLDLAVSCLLEYERLNNVPADMTMYSTLLQQLNLDSRSNDVKWLFHRMLAWKLEPSLKAWNQYILSFKKDGSFNEESLFQNMAAQGLDPDVGTYYSLMEVYASVNDLASAGRCCEKALGKGFILSTRMWHILLLSHLQSNDINGFDRNYNISLSEMNSDQYFQSLYMRRLMATGEVHSAMNTAKSMLSTGIYPRRFTYDILMKSLICHGRHDYAIKLFEQMQQAEVIGIHNTYHMVLMTQLRNLDFYENPKEEMVRMIEDTFADMKSMKVVPSTDTYNSILSTLVSLQNSSLVFHFLKHFEFHPNIITYTLLLKFISPSVLHSDLKRLAASAFHDHHPEDPLLENPAAFDRIFFTVLFSVLSSSKNASATQQDQYNQFSRFFELLVSHNHLSPDVFCFNSLMAGHLRLQNNSEVIRLYTLMVRDYRVRPSLRTFTSLIAAVGSSKMQTMMIPIILPTNEIIEIEATALNIYQSLERCGIQPDIALFRILAKIVCMKRDVGEAKWLVDEMRRLDIDEDSFAFKRVARLLT